MLIHSSAAFLNESLLKIPNRRFVPDALVQSVVSGSNLQELGCRWDKLQGSSIAFDAEQSQKAALGEFVERYASATYRIEDRLVGSMKSLGGQHRFLHPKYYRYYNKQQYQVLKTYGIAALSEEDVIAWTRAYDYLNDEEVLVPAEAVYMPFECDLPNSPQLMVGATSTGIAAGKTLKDAVLAGFCECAERHAFAQFWYRQNSIHYQQYTAKLILEHYANEPSINSLFDNPLVKLKVFDLSSFAPLETMVVFLYFDYKNWRYQSLGCAARFHKKDALIKAAMEAYQGVEYAISLMEKQLLPESMDLQLINDFDTHFHFYNRYPEYRQVSKILREAQDFLHGDEVFYHDESKENLSFSKESLRSLGLEHLVYKDITPIDVEMIPYKVARVICPSWALLTGQHAWPFLGQEFREDEALFLDYPHPFP